MEEYTITIEELIKRPIIRHDQVHEYLNKMTDQEIDNFYEEIKQVLKSKNTCEKCPDWNAWFLAEIIDREILYNIFKLK